MCDQVAQIQETILCVKEERRFLLRRLIEIDGDNSLIPPDPLPPTNKKPPKKRSNSEASNKSKNSSKSPTVSSQRPRIKKQQIIQTISVDQMGRPIYPINMGTNLSIFDLGEIVHDRPGYHTEHWIYPIGFVSTRIYGHMKEPERKCTYTCKIIDGGDDYPR